MLERNDQGKSARRYFIACEKRLRVELQPTQDLTTVPGLRRSLRDSATHLLAALEYREKLESNLVLAEERAFVAEEKALDQAKQAGREERAIPLSVLLNHTINRHGHGPIVGRKMIIVVFGRWFGLNAKRPGVMAGPLMDVELLSESAVRQLLLWQQSA